MQWRSSFGGLCAAQPRSCDFRERTPQDNWFFTQYIRYINATEVFVNITANFQECRLNPICTQLYVDMYRYERNGVDATAARNTANYQFVRRIEQPSDFSGQQYAASFSFIPGDTNGVYLGFRDTGTCINILCVQVYYSTLPQMPDATTPPSSTPPPTTPASSTLPPTTPAPSPLPTTPAPSPLPATPALTTLPPTTPAPTTPLPTTPALTTLPPTGVTINIAVGIAVVVTGSIAFIVGVLVGVLLYHCISKHRSQLKPDSALHQQQQTEPEHEEVPTTSGKETFELKAIDADESVQL